ncbi:MAG TPA: serine hydrolase, partial [Thermoanaerobaculia bacterium]
MKYFMAPNRFRLLVLLLAVAGDLAAAAPQSGLTLPKPLDDEIAAAIEEWQIPGAAVVVVKDGRTVAAKGYGVRELGKPDRVDADTIFDIASLTKSFTAAAIASMVDEGRLDWDKPIRSYLPAVQFSDPWLTANVTLRDLLCHRTGVRNNAAPFRGHLTRTQVVGLFRYLEPLSAFRTKWEYSNIGYALAGEVAATAAGASWEEVVARRIILPLDMTRTTADFDLAPSMGNIASGHVVTNGVQRAVSRGSERSSTAAAGAVQSSARDLATWLLFQLGDGTFKGRRVLSASSMAEMHAPQIYVPTRAEFRKSRQLEHFAAYGFGWQVWDYRGHYMLWHSGNGDGQLAYMVLLPDSNLGVAVLTNSWRTTVVLNVAMAQRILDSYLNLPTRDYVAEYRESWKKSEEKDAADEKALEASRLKNTSPALPLLAYAGTYRDQLGLDVVVGLENEALTFQYAGGVPASMT